MLPPVTHRGSAVRYGRSHSKQSLSPPLLNEGFALSRTFSLGDSGSESDAHELYRKPTTLGTARIPRLNGRIRVCVFKIPTRSLAGSLHPPGDTMHLHSYRLRNFRRLRDVHVELASDISIFVGAKQQRKNICHAGDADVSLGR